MNNSSRFFARAWRPVILALCLGAIAYVLYFHNLAHLVPGYAHTELQTYRSAASWHTIVHNPINAPYKLLVWLAIALGHHSFLATRIVAAAFGLVGAIIFFLAARLWYGTSIALLATTLFATSAGFLHVARFGSAEILQMSVLFFMGVASLYRKSTARRLPMGYLAVVALALLWYVPGMIWFELFGLVLLRADVIRQLKQTELAHKLGWSVLFLVCIAPLAIAVGHTPQLALQAAGLPTTVHALARTPQNTLSAVLSVGIHSSGHPENGVGHAPLLDAVELILGALGAYYYLLRERSRRSIFLVGSMLISLVLIGLNGAVAFAMVLPLLYLFIASGIGQLLGQWLRVFPRNPIARLTGISLVCIMLGFSVLYQLRSYFVAWPHDTATRQTFDHPEP